MRLFAPTCYLASALVATLVLVTTSLPQSPSGPPDTAISKRAFPDPVPIVCLRVGSLDHQIDIGNKRRPAPLLGYLGRGWRLALPCGQFPAGGQSAPFIFPLHATSAPLRLHWNFGDPHVIDRVIKIIEVKPSAADLVLLTVPVEIYRFSGFNVVGGSSYYIQLSGPPSNFETVWWFTYLWVSSVPSAHFLPIRLIRHNRK